jgi:amino acid adenylation domain-containing protein
VGRGSAVLHQRIANVARSAPASLAVSDPTESLTFAELDARANALAWYLRDLGVGPGVLVGLCLARSAANVIAALAIAKAGGGYIGLDPFYPDPRIQYMLRNAQASIVVADASVAGRLAGDPFEVVQLDEGTCSFGARTDAPENLAGPDDVAYVIYTSGSTGEPKGVMVSHRSLTSLADWHLEAFGLTGADRSSMLASPAFDASVWELWATLAGGASLQIPDQLTPTIPDMLRDWMIAAGVTVGFVPTPMAEALLELDWPPDAPLRLMLTGGDVLHRGPQSGAPFTMINNYGVTEGTVVSTSGPVSVDDGTAARPGIGRPISGASLHVLDSDGREVPAGEVGELYIGGPSVAMGYVNRPSLTAERFVPDPFAADAEATMYRTGDSVRIRADGEVQFVGRLDDQVQIRGHRVEPDEIAAVLRTHPAVGTCAVVTCDDGAGRPQLVAYVVAPKGPKPAGRALRRHLLASLPDYMVPAAFVELTSLPVTPNGKLDRSALPAPTRTGAQDRVGGETPTEVVLADILDELLGIDDVGRDDNFFELGGHSLMGAQLVARVRERFGVDVTLLDVFDNPTVFEIAEVVDQAVVDLVASLSDDDVDQLLSASGSHE